MIIVFCLISLIILGFVILMFYNHKIQSSEFRKLVSKIEQMISEGKKGEALDIIESKIPECRNYSELNKLKDLSWRAFNV